MKVCLISMVFPHPRPGFWPGIERQVGDFATALRDAGVDVTVITGLRNGGGPRELHQGIRIFRQPDAASRLGRAGYLLDFHVRSFGRSATRLDEALEGADVVESFVPLPGASRLRRPGRRLFAFFAHRDRPARWTEYLHQPFHHVLERRFFKQVDGVIVASSESRRVLIEQYAVPGERIHVIPLGVSPRFLSSGGASSGSSGGGRGIRLLYVGPLIRRKGLDRLIEALPLLRDDGIAFTLTLAGRGPEQAALEARLANLRLTELVSFAGFVADEALPSLYREADLFVFPSTKEGFGLVLVEAMASGLPVAASLVPPMPEVLGDAALFFDPADPRDIARKIAAAARDPRLREQIAAAGARRVRERFVWSRVVDQTLSVWKGARAA